MFNRTWLTNLRNSTLQKLGVQKLTDVASEVKQQSVYTRYMGNLVEASQILQEEDTIGEDLAQQLIRDSEALCALVTN